MSPHESDLDPETSYKRQRIAEMSEKGRPDRFQFPRDLNWPLSELIFDSAEWLDQVATEIWRRLRQEPDWHNYPLLINEQLAIGVGTVPGIFDNAIEKCAVAEKPAMAQALITIRDEVLNACRQAMQANEQDAQTPPHTHDGPDPFIECTHSGLKPTLFFLDANIPLAVGKLRRLADGLNRTQMVGEKLNGQGQPSEASDANRMTAESMVKRKEEQGRYDVFLSHNSNDKAVVEEIAKRLKTVGIRPWLDKWEMVSGQSWVSALQKTIPSINCAAVFYGPAGIGPWQQQETEAILLEFVSKGKGAIPVLLPEAGKEPDLPIFLKTKTWVDMREWKQAGNDAFYRLVCDIVGRAPGDSPVVDFTAQHVFEWQFR